MSRWILNWSSVSSPERRRAVWSRNCATRSATNCASNSSYRYMVILLHRGRARTGLGEFGVDGGATGADRLAELGRHGKARLGRHIDRVDIDHKACGLGRLAGFESGRALHLVGEKL